jgi:hypothetical protein
LSEFADDQSMPRYDPRAAFSSAALQGSGGERSELEVEAELIIQGRAAPSTQIELFDVKIRVGEDGRFSIRRPVADPLILSLALARYPTEASGETDQG